jgi:uncharacterized protein YdaU (DUF1376 family)
MGKGPPSFQFYPMDFLSSRSVTLMSAEAVGGYFRLLCHAWLGDEPGVLDDDDATLAALSGLGDHWSACSVSIRRAFRATSREGRRVLIQQRMVDEYQAFEGYRMACREAGLASARAMTREQRIERARSAARKRWGPSDAKEMPVSMPVSTSGDDLSMAKSLPATETANAILTPANLSVSVSVSREEESKDRGSAAAPVGAIASQQESKVAAMELVASVTQALAPTHPRAPLMASVKAQVEALQPPEKNRLHALAGWLAKTGVRDEECILRFVADAIPRISKVRNLYAYYALDGSARSSIEGHWRADAQERESARWRAEEWAWVREFRAYQPDG